MKLEEAQNDGFRSANKEFDSRIFLTVFRKNWTVYPFMLLFTLGVSYIYLRYTKPTYKSSAIIQRSSQDEGKRILEIENFQTENDLSEDVELLRSTFLFEKALKNLKLNTSYFSEGEILTEEKYLLSPYHVNLFELKDSSLVGKRIDLLKRGGELLLSFSIGGVARSVLIEPGQVVNNEYFHLLLKITKPALFESDMMENNLYFVFNRHQDLTKQLIKDLSVYPINPEAKTIEISFKSNNPRLATDVVSSVISAFFAYDLDKKSRSSANILSFIDQQLDSVFNRLKKSELAIQSFRDNAAVGNTTFLTEKTLEEINLYESSLLEIDLELELFRDLERTVDESDRIEIFKVIPTIIGTPYEKMMVMELEELHDLLIQKEDESYSITPNNDRIKLLNKNIDAQTSNIIRIIDAVKEKIKFKQRGIEKKITELESKLYGIPAKEMEFSSLQRTFNLNEKYYTLLIEKKTQYAISNAGYTMDNMVLHAPNRATLISPNPKFVFSAGVVLAFLLSSIYLILRYLAYNNIHDVDELRGLLPDSVGFLGGLPKLTRQTENSVLLVNKSPKSAIAEGFRHVRSNLQFILNDEKPTVIGVSSSISGEGKTFFAINLAGIMAMSDKRVIIIDLDLRKPKIHVGFNADNTTGMSAILSDKASWQDCIRHSELEGLHFLVAGAVPPNPSELIFSGKIWEVITELKDAYDVIIIDNPPIGLVSDGVEILNRSDCPVYLFRANYSKRNFAKGLKDVLENQKISKLFAVLNGVDTKSTRYKYGYGQYYEETVKSRFSWQFWKR